MIGVTGGPSLLRGTNREWRTGARDLKSQQSGIVSIVANYIYCLAPHTSTRKFDRGLSDLLHSELHWLDIYQRVQYKLGVTIYRDLQNRAPQYLVDCCLRTSDVSSRQRLRSANRRQLVVPRHRRSKFGRRSFSVAAPMVWNSFPDSLRDPSLSIDNFRSTLKTHLFAAQRNT